MKHEKWMAYCQYGVGSVPAPKKRVKREVVKKVERIPVKRVSQLSEQELLQLFEVHESVNKRHHAPRYSCSHEER